MSTTTSATARRAMPPALFVRACVLAVCALASRPGRAAEHWAWVAPRPLPPPATRDAAWAAHPLDAFVLARLEDEGIAPAPPAPRARLIRRLYLDLTGLPPPVDRVDAFIADERPDAYDRLVDELLASPHYGERQARRWLDLARYADSNGFQRDGHRSVWPYRDWVVAAMNADLPFDRFTIEQLAGDLIDEPSLAQRVATGFHRGTTVNVEAGVDEEANRINAVFDRVNTTAAVWLGTTLECAQCHDHKYDPFDQTDYYRLFAYFNSSAKETEPEGDAARRFTGPWIEVPEPETRARRRKEAEAARVEAARRLERAEAAAEAASAQTAPEREVLGAREALAAAERELERLEPPTTLVMVELETPRTTRILHRGDFLDPADAVRPGTPAILPPPATGTPENRLGLARWLVDGRNPLVARVVVNRWWDSFFGRGLVETLEDFGTRGAAPSHPRLLDWLATELVRRDWSRKALHRLIVTSTTYRQSARLEPGARQRDPHNRLLARSPRIRLSAEAIRDVILAACGLLERRVGGPPVYPPQPAGIWRVLGRVDNTYPTSRGAHRYRRGLYTVWRRSSPYPSFVNFDAPDRASVCVRRPRTNTPLQALTLMNDPVYVGASLALAARVLRETPGAAAAHEIVAHAFRLCLARHPSREELEHLAGVYTAELERLRASPSTARRLVATHGAEHGLPGGLDVCELAATFFVATIITNLDEVITRG